MVTKLVNELIAWAKRVEACGDAWAAKRLTPEEFAEATALDARLKREFWRWVAYFAMASVVGALIVVGLRPEIAWWRALLYTSLTLAYAGAAAASAWYGYRKWIGRPVWMTFAIFIGLMLAGVVVGFIVTSFTSGKPLTDITWEKVAKGGALALLIGIALASLLVGVSQMRRREALQRAARLEAEADRERLARHSMQAELKLLQAQVEPHFLFNTLANLRHLVQTGSPDALAMLDHLILYLRTALPEIRAGSSTLGREAQLAHAYLEILRIRMGAALEVAIDIPAELANEPFPPLMLMTLVENAVKHGVAPLGRGRVAVRALGQGGRIRVEVEDDGRGLQEPIGQGVGLANLRERLRALFGERARLDLSGRDPQGTLAVIEVPLEGAAA